mmetsp:Transcript_76466/g.212387  ORF Transcript_76466/g.212387 Transcript_76466/m.212387 type:complete len:205 (-) Transcript_76466:16-630(-)
MIEVTSLAQRHFVNKARHDARAIDVADAHSKGVEQVDQRQPPRPQPYRGAPWPCSKCGGSVKRNCGTNFFAGERGSNCEARPTTASSLASNASPNTGHFFNGKVWSKVAGAPAHGCSPSTRTFKGTAPCLATAVMAAGCCDDRAGGAEAAAVAKRRLGDPCGPYARMASCRRGGAALSTGNDWALDERLVANTSMRCLGEPFGP